MRQEGNGRSDLPVWSIAQTVVAVIDGTRGQVHAVGKTTIDVLWTDCEAPITYPKDALGIRKPFPWE